MSLTKTLLSILQCYLKMSFEGESNSTVSIIKQMYKTGTDQFQPAINSHPIKSENCLPIKGKNDSKK